MNTGEPKAPSAGEGAEQKTCPVCGVRFGCMASQEVCWCAEVKLSSATTADLRARFSDCLCPRCLVLAAEGEIRQPGAKNPTEKPAI